MHRNGRHRITVLALVALSSGALAGCPGRLQSPERFGGARSDAGPSEERDGDTPGIDVPALLAESCGAGDCHDAEAPTFGLDLVSPDLAERVVGEDATACSGRVLVDPDDPDASFLLEKVVDEAPQCGTRMPPVGRGEPFTDEQVAALRAWIEEQ